MALAPAYFDTSVLVKRYTSEPGSARARALLRRHRLLSSAIAPAEAMATFRCRHAAGEIGARALAELFRLLATNRRNWDLVALTSLVLGRAEELIQALTLRTLDAVHIASVLTFQADTGLRLTFVTASARQRAAAQRLNLEVVWVE